MRKQMRKIITMLLGIALLAGCLLPAQKVKAADGYSAIGIPYSRNMTISKSNSGYYIMTGKNLGNGEIMSIKSSNRKVITPMDNADIYDAVWADSFDTRKTGTAKLTITVKLKNGKMKKYVAKVKVVKYSNPVKQFKLGSRNLASKFGKNANLFISAKKDREKISVQAKSGWKVKKISYTYYKGGKWRTRTIHNKDYIRYEKNGTITVSMYKKKTKQTEMVTVGVNR